jgi:hypothetical protein
VLIAACILTSIPGSEAEYAPGKLTPAGVAEPEPETVIWSAIPVRKRIDDTNLSFKAFLTAQQ